MAILSCIDLYSMCYKIRIAVVYVVQHVGGCIQVL